MLPSYIQVAAVVVAAEVATEVVAVAVAPPRAFRFARLAAGARRER